ncbi:MAG: hypothetical protein V3V95_05750 [Thermodesulfobacteriota bacterium]
MPNSKDIPSALDRTCFNLSFRILSFGALLLVILLFCPTTAYSRLAPIDPKDPFIYKRLTLDIRFDLDYSRSKTNNTVTSTNHGYSQSYSLSFADNIIDPRLWVYTAYVNYSLSTRSSGTSSDSLSMGFNSTILRKLRYPISIYESRTYGDNHISDSYGLRSLLRFRRLPLTNVEMSWHRIESDTNITMDSAYSISMVKNIGPTSNRFSYSASEADNGSKNSSISLKNSVRLSRSSHISNAFSRYERLPSNQGFDRGYALTSSLRSNTSDRFKQSHSYAIFSAESAVGTKRSNTDGQSYSGNWAYSLTEKIGLGGGLSVSESSSKGQSSESESESFNIRGGIGYKIAKNLSTKLSSSFSRSESNHISGLGNNTGDEFFNLKASVSYGRSIREMTFSSSYSIGYNEQLSLPDRGGGTGMGQSLNLGLGNIRYKKVYFDTNAGFSRIDNLTGDLWSKSKSFRITAKPKYLVKYGSASGSYLYSSSDSWQTYQDSTRHRMRFRARTKRFRKTRGSMSQTYSISKAGNISTSTHRSMNTSFSVNHSRRIKGGKATFSGSYSRRRFESGESLTRTSGMSITGTYRRPLLNRINWNVSGGFFRSKDLEANRSTSSYHLRNDFTFSIRAWLVTVRQLHLANYNSTESDKSKQDSIMVTLSRRIMRIF